MGIKTAPAWFQRFMTNTFKEFIDRNTLKVYLDDTILYTQDIKSHVDEAFQIFNRLRQSNLKCSFDKSKILTESIEFLGNEITNHQIKPTQKRAEAIAKQPKPTTLKELQRWLGVGNYLRKYIKNYAELAKPLYDRMDIKNVPKELRKRNGSPNGKLST